MIVAGTRTGDISFTAPFRYVTVPLSFLLGFLIWGQVPDRLRPPGRCRRDGGGPARGCTAAPHGERRGLRSPRVTQGRGQPARGAAGRGGDGLLLHQRRLHQGARHAGADRRADGGARRVVVASCCWPAARLGLRVGRPERFTWLRAAGRGRRHLRLPRGAARPAARRHLHALLRRPAPADRRRGAVP